MLFSAAFIEKAIYIYFLLFIYYIKTYTLTFYFFWEFFVALPGFLYLKMRYWFKMYFNLNSNGKWSSKNFQILSKFNKNAKHVILHSIRQFLQNSKFDLILIYPYQSRTIVSSEPLPWYFFLVNIVLSSQFVWQIRYITIGSFVLNV